MRCRIRKCPARRPGIDETLHRDPRRINSTSSGPPAAQQYAVFFVSAAYDGGATTGWTFAGGLEPGSVLDVVDLVSRFLAVTPTAGLPSLTIERLNALYPVDLMPPWLKVLSHVNPLSYQVDALRGLLIGTPSHLGLDFAVLAAATVAAIAVASALLGRLAR